MDNYLLSSHTLKFALEHILMYELAGDFTNKYFNYADPKYREGQKIGNDPYIACPYNTRWKGMAVSYFWVFYVYEMTY